jgi:chloride channel 3/4/5
VIDSIWKLALALIFYLAMLVITFGIKIPCGLFVPSLAIGAIVGRITGVCMELISL